MPGFVVVSILMAVAVATGFAVLCGEQLTPKRGGTPTKPAESSPEK